MKLKTKLLPFATIATLGATVAPIALTSCGTKNANKWFDFAKYIYNPVMEKHATTALTEDEANAAYFGVDGEWDDEVDVAERFSQDYVWSYSRLISLYSTEEVKEDDSKTGEGGAAAPGESGGGSVEAPKKADVKATQTLNNYAADARDASGYSSYKLKFNYVKIGHSTVYDATTELIPYQFPTVSYQIEYQIASTIKNGPSSTVNTQYTGELTVTDLPIRLFYDEVTYGSEKFDAWRVTPYEDLLLDTEGITGAPGDYTGKIPFSYVDEYKSVRTLATDNQSITQTTYGDNVVYSGSFKGSLTAKADLEEFLFDNTKYACPNMCSFYMLSVSEK